jgi:hypothetical protein
MFKNILLCFTLAFSTIGIAHAEPEKKKVCVPQKNQKTGKTVEVCKVIKVHKKLEVTPVPEKKKK